MLASTEGEGMINGKLRVPVSFQSKPGIFNLSVLSGLDYLLSQLKKRNMTVVLYLSNNWEWSGGFLQYLNWHGLIADSVLQRTLSWDEYRDYDSKFYACNACKEDYYRQVQLIISHKNRFTSVKYLDDPTIMAWELANEPRPMRPKAIRDYESWIRHTAALIKRIDPHHMVTLGTEGTIAVEGEQVYRTISSLKDIDYLTIHIWPKNWGWFSDSSIVKSWSNICSLSENYIKLHEKIAMSLDKPLVVEEFGLPRNSLSYSPGASTFWRDAYYKFLLDLWNVGHSAIAGYNFWSFSGYGRPIPGQVFWKKGDSYLGDPPVEEQGLNSVFDADKSTWQVIETFMKNNKL